MQDFFCRGARRRSTPFSRLAAITEVSETEVNPLIILPQRQGVVMADALLSTTERDCC